MKELKDEGINISSEINVNVYAGLTPEEARSVGNRHNFMMTTLPVTFQQKVEQTRKFYKEGITGGALVKKIKKIIQETEETKELSEDSCSTVVAVATYSETEYLKYEKLVQIHEQKSGCDKNISQRLFRALQGCSESNKLEFLSKALEDGLKITAIHVEKARARESIKKVFHQNLAISSWEEIIKKYPDAGEELERFVDKKSKRKFVPEELVNFCQQKLKEATETGPQDEQEQDTQVPVPDNVQDLEEDFKIEINISFKDVSIVENANVKTILDLHKTLILKSLLKIQFEE